MSKRKIIIICSIVAVIIVVAVAVFFITKAVVNNSNNSGAKAQNETKNEDVEKIIIEIYDDDFNVERTIEITNKKQIKELKSVCENPSLEQDDMTPYLVVENDIKLDLTNGVYYIFQSDLKDYCFYNNDNTNTKLTIKMPEGLLEKVNEILANN